MQNKARIDKLARKNGLKLWSLRIYYPNSRFKIHFCCLFNLIILGYTTSSPPFFLRDGSLPADVLWGSFVTHSFLPHGRLLNTADFYVHQSQAVYGFL